MSAWHKRRDPEALFPTLKDLAHEGYLIFYEEDGQSFTAWKRQQPPLPSVLLVDEVREPGPPYQAEWTLFHKERGTT